jgi:hypothetical protein
LREQPERRGDERKGRRLVAAQQAVELLELAALALPPHEAIFGGVVNTPTVQQPVTLRPRSPALVELPDALLGLFQE